MDTKVERGKGKLGLKQTASYLLNLSPLITYSIRGSSSMCHGKPQLQGWSPEFNSQNGCFLWASSIVLRSLFSPLLQELLSLGINKGRLGLSI